MQPTIFTLLCLGLMALVVAEMYRDAEECKPADQPEPEQKSKPSHEIGRRIVLNIRRKLNRRN